MSLALSGIGVSRGVAIGKAHIILRGSIEVLESAIPVHLIEDEIARFLKAVDSARMQLEATQERIPASTGVDIAAFIETHLLMLDDATLVATPVDLIREHHCNAEWALKLQRDAVVSVFEQMDDAYLRTRRDDIDHVINRIQRILLDSSQGEEQGENIVPENTIVLAYDLTPAETVMFEHQGIRAFATECGGPLSHTAILARSMQIPAMVGTHGLQRYIRDGETIILDGLQGVLIAGADEQTLDYYRERQEQEFQRQIELAKFADTPAVTSDGTPVRLMANIELPEDIDAVSRTSANGVGLYRTEFLFMNRPEPPDEEEQYDCYVSVIEALKGKPLTIRTLDMGADKQADGISGSSNPALGLRAIRLCLKNRAQFRPQLRAILRASAHGPVRLMIPMLSNTRELHQVLSLINDTKIALQREALAFAPDVQIGGMIEVPAAALTAADFASHLDFLSIGTNDLIQYTLAIDRVDDEVNYLFDPLHPAVLRLIKMTIDAGKAAGIPVAMCGEMAGDPRYTRLLLGMGLNEFSMHHTALPEVKSVIHSSSIEALVPLVQELLNNTRTGRIPERVDSLNQNTL
ncbi:MAG: phosphoenolpyruvate--protein phosphotransferase [Gammaproteobacteria bacterium]|jgi:phosphotransferase system enzyme I (PtsI)|nr:phosphoenolpyruvate--protein phosphotransferase [Gammaproteobacteria bacterium]